MQTEADNDGYVLQKISRCDVNTIKGILKRTLAERTSYFMHKTRQKSGTKRAIP